MRTRSLALVALTTAGALALSACGGGREGTADDAAAGAADGFAEDAVIGVSLPWLGTQNWAEAESMFTAELTDAGFDPLVQAADNKVTQQQQQIEAMIERGAEVIVVGPIDGTQLGSVLERAAAEGIAVIGYDRLIENTTGVDGVVQFGSIRTGELQGQSLLDGLAARKGEPPYYVELFGGGPADPNAPSFFEGAMSVLQPKIDDGTLVVASGQTDFTQAATPDWDNAKAQARMDSLLSGFYSSDEIDGVLSPNDGIARAIMTSTEQAGQAIPVVTGLDAENESVVSVWEGEQWSTVAKPTQDLVARTVELIQALQQGEELPEPDESVDNGQKDVAVYLLDPVVVTQENAEEVFAEDADRLALLQ
ncbi:sugar-binding protein [Cellulomonas sp. S1-8]|uniref:substrate-binding domain-containing protein n=1 Tax=Cellulomonas sp. S1-8 TaxID=2904790 RepID=UPI002243FAB8|nr:sugar-binding protein [Cellulomonas sp. S1-8]UZN03137.1 sugar ABC transporter substrate-binding protein [Cellulomonas sp. S1-8]